MVLGIIIGIVLSIAVFYIYGLFKKLRVIENEIEPFKQLFDADISDFMFDSKLANKLYFCYDGDSFVEINTDNKEINIYNEDFTLKHSYSPYSKTMCDILYTNLMKEFRSEIEKFENYETDDDDETDEDIKIEFYLLDENGDPLEDIDIEDFKNKIRESFGDINFKNLDQEYEFSEYSSEYNKIEFESSYSVDDILDKISLKGIESLTQNEKDFLDEQ